MLADLLRRISTPPLELAGSILYDENTFYAAFLKDLERCRSEVIIECPFIAYRRLVKPLSVLQKLKEMRIRIVINTRDPHDHDGDWREEAHRALAALQRIGAHVIYTPGHHRKLAIIDREVMYEGSLNILSQNSSSEIMRRIDSVQLAWQMVRFIELDKLVL